ncbi:hypothetical protein [Alishewanella longhuensis]
MLIYPAWQKYPAGTELGAFRFSDKLTLLVMPFDLEAQGAATDLILKLQVATSWLKCLPYTEAVFQGC